MHSTHNNNDFFYNDDAMFDAEEENVQEEICPVNWEEKYQMLQKEYAGAMLRARADEDNLRKRLKKDQEDAVNRAITKFAIDLISLADDIERGLLWSETAQNVENMREGLRLMHANFNNFLTKNHIMAFGEVGDAFDATKHQSLGYADNTQNNNTKMACNQSIDASAPTERLTAEMPPQTAQHTHNIEAECIAQIMQKGYTIQNQLLRAALVMLHKSE